MLSSAQAQARDDGNQLNDNHRFYDPQRVSEMYWDNLSVKAGTASADAIRVMNSAVSGLAGTTGLLVLRGETYFSFSGGYSLGWLAPSFAPGSGGCLLPKASCRAAKQASSSIAAGSSGGGPAP